MLVDDLRNRELGNAMEDSDEAIVKWVKHRVLARKFEKKMWQSHHSNVVHELIHQPTTTNLFITVDQETNKLIVRNGVPPEPSFGIVDVTYFIKAQGLILSHENLDETLIYGTIVIKQTAASVLEIMEQTLYPNIFDSREWNQSSKLELQGLYHRFMASLTESANEESSSTALYFPSKSNKYFDKESTTYDKDVVQQLEAVSIHWIRQVKDVLNSHEHNITLDHQGPMEELRFWESRSEDLVGISQQLHCPQVLDILSILKEAKSKYAKPVEALSGALRQGSEEAANSVKFLRLLQGPCKLLAKLEAAEIPSLMLKFLNCIRLIHVHSANYNTNEKVSDLIRRVSSEIIRQCTFHISLQEIFYGNLKKSMTTLNDCIKCGKAWKKCYNRMTITVNRQKNENGNSEEHWKLNDPSIFAEMDAFVQRCDDLIDICNSRVQFVERLDGTFDNSDKMYVPTFGWTNGPEIENSVRVVQEAFLVQINRLNRLEYSILNARESRWHGDYNAFKMASKVRISIFILGLF
jgi:dynein heavy chain